MLVMPASAQAQGGLTLDGTPLNVFADGLGRDPGPGRRPRGGSVLRPRRGPGARRPGDQGGRHRLSAAGRVRRPRPGRDQRRAADDHRPRRRQPHAAHRVPDRSQHARQRGPHLHRRHDADQHPLRDHERLGRGRRRSASACSPTSTSATTTAATASSPRRAPRFVGGRDDASGLVYGLQEVTPWSAFQEGDFELVFDNFAAGGLNSTVDSAAPDNGVGATWQLDNLAPGRDARDRRALAAGLGRAARDGHAALRRPGATRTVSCMPDRTACCRRPQPGKTINIKSAQGQGLLHARPRPRNASR